eukprot:403332051
MINNNVDFSQDEEDDRYFVATIKIVNKKPPQSAINNSQYYSQENNATFQSEFQHEQQQMNVGMSNPGVNGLDRIQNKNTIKSNQQNRTLVGKSTKIGSAGIAGSSKVKQSTLSQVSKQPQTQQIVKKKQPVQTQSVQQQIVSGHQNELSKFDNKIRQLEEQAASKQKPSNNRPVSPSPIRTGSSQQQESVNIQQNVNNFSVEQKKLSLQNLLKTIEEIYAYRYQKDTWRLQNNMQQNFNPADKAFYVSVFDYLNQRYKNKKSLDQATIDFIASVDYFRLEGACSEVETFYKFFIQDYSIENLLFFLYMRSLAEKESGQVITRIAVGDVRQVKLSRNKCYKLFKGYYLNMSVQYQDEEDQDSTAQNSIENQVEQLQAKLEYEAREFDKIDIQTQDIQLTFFLEFILQEYIEQVKKMQEQFQQDEDEIVVSGQENFNNQLDINIDEVSPFQQNLSGLKSFNQGNGHRNFENLQSKLQQEQLDLEDESNLQNYVQSQITQNPQQQINKSYLINLSQLTLQQRSQLKDKLLKYIIGNKVNQVISFMLSHYASQGNNGTTSDGGQSLSKEVLDMIKEEIRTVLQSKIKLLLEAVFTQNEQQWANLLFIEQINEQQRNQFRGVYQKVFEAVQNGLSLTNQNDPNINLRIEDQEEIAKMMLHINELKQELAKLVSILTLQAKRGFDTDSDEQNQNFYQQTHNSNNYPQNSNKLQQNNQLNQQQLLQQDLQQFYASGGSCSDGSQNQRDNQRIINNYMRNRL